MNSLSLVLGLLLMGVAGSVHAEDTPKQLEAIGGLQTADGVVSGSAEQIAAISIACGTTACGASLYDTSGLSTTSNANGRVEFGAPANETRVFDLRQFPIRFRTGVVLNVDSNTNAVGVYRVATQ